MGCGADREYEAIGGLANKVFTAEVSFQQIISCEILCRSNIRPFTYKSAFSVELEAPLVAEEVEGFGFWVEGTNVSNSRVLILILVLGLGFFFPPLPLQKDQEYYYLLLVHVGTIRIEKTKTIDLNSNPLLAL